MGKGVLTAAAGVLVLALIAGGCRTFTSPARSRKVNDSVTWIDYDATRRGTVIVKMADGRYRVLSEPAPDVAMGVVSEFVGKASYEGISGEASAKVTETIAELGKRTETIMFLRESMFRLNEMQSTAELESAEVVRLYERVLDAALALAKAEQLRAAENVDPAVAEAILAEVTNSTPASRALRDELDALLPMPVKADVVPDQTFANLEAYAEYLVRNDPEFAGQSVSGIRARRGGMLRKLVTKLRAAKAE